MQKSKIMPHHQVNNSKSKLTLHPRNKHHGRYDFQALIKSYPELSDFITTNPKQEKTINFFNPAAVKALNTALLQYHYKIEYWDIPSGYLCPPIPGRADYIHHLADILSEQSRRNIPRGKQVTCLDIGVGANCIYPIIGVSEYDWSFIGSDIDPIAIEAAKKIVAQNPRLTRKIDLRLQKNPKHFFKGVLKKNERIDLSICNPPFHASLEEAQANSQRKLKNLKQEKSPEIILNFGGQHQELWCEGGELQFIKNMIVESQAFSTQCCWFTSLVAKEVHLKKIHQTLKKVKASEVKTIDMAQGNKKSRLVAWTFLNLKQRKLWQKMRWK